MDKGVGQLSGLVCQQPQKPLNLPMVPESPTLKEEPSLTKTALLKPPDSSQRSGVRCGVAQSPPPDRHPHSHPFANIESEPACVRSTADMGNHGLKMRPTSRIRIHADVFAMPARTIYGYSCPRRMSPPPSGGKPAANPMQGRQASPSLLRCCMS